MGTSPKRPKAPIDKHWLERSDLTIHEAAFWMVFDSDPVDHEKRCLQDQVYADNYQDHPSGSDAVEKSCEAILSAIRSDLIQTTKDVRSNNGDLTTRTHIRKTDWLNWCRDIGYPELANNLGPGPKDSQPIVTKKEGAPATSLIEQVPGMIPRTAIGKLAIKAAWEIELMTGKEATANQVIARLEELINSEPILLEKIPHGIRWMTTNNTEANFSLEACGKALTKWRSTRP